MAKIGYARVSTVEQNIDRQLEALNKADCEKIYCEKISGKNMERPELQRMLEYVREGDILVVESYSRLARSTRDLLEIIDKLKNKGVQFISMKERIDTTTPQGNLMLTIFAGLSQFERETLLQRQSEGIAIAKAKGVYKGRKAIALPSNWIEVYTLWKEGTYTAKVAQKKLGLQSATFYRMVKKYEANKDAK